MVAGSQGNVEGGLLPSRVVIGPVIAVSGELCQRVARAIPVKDPVQFEEGLTEFIILVRTLEEKPVAKTDRDGRGIIQVEES